VNSDGPEKNVDKRPDFVRSRNGSSAGAAFCRLRAELILTSNDVCSIPISHSERFIAVLSGDTWHHGNGGDLTGRDVFLPAAPARSACLAAVIEERLPAALLTDSLCTAFRLDDFAAETVTFPRCFTEVAGMEAVTNMHCTMARAP